MLTDDYVWDQTGAAEPDVLAWEQSLQAIRHRAPLRAVAPPMEDAGPTSNWAKPVIFGALLSSALTVLLIWGFVRLGPGAPPETITEPAMVAVSGPPPQPTEKAEAPAATTPEKADTATPSDRKTLEARLEEIERALVTIQSTLAEIRAAVVAVDVRTRTRVSPRPNKPSPRPPVTVDEILDPSLGKRAPSENASPAEKVRLSAADIKAGIAPVKPIARACRDLSGGESGDKVTVRLAIVGATGRVRSSAAVGRHATTAVGACVADALKSARFPTFERAQIGVLYPIRLR